MTFIQYNPNPKRKSTIDCTVRALSKAFNTDWDDAYIRLCMKGFVMKNMPSANEVWHELLKDESYTRHIIPNTCPDCYTVRSFCYEHPYGLYILGTGSHVIAVENGNYYDNWDSGDEVPIYYWERRND